MMKDSNPTDRAWSGLCAKVMDLIPKEFGEEAWYLIVAATLAGSPTPDLLGSFYTYLTTHDPRFSTEQRIKYLSQRLRDVLFKITILVGMPRVLCILAPLANAEGDVESKSKSSILSDKWRLENMDVRAIHHRGVEAAVTIYGPSLLPKIFDRWGSHKEDMKFNEFFTAYGLYLSDFEVMTPLETEAVVYSSISCLGLKRPGMWHLRGIGRLLGARGTGKNARTCEKMKSIELKLKSLKHAVMSVVEFVGDDYAAAAKLEEWANIGDVVEELDGWGDDQ